VIIIYPECAQTVPSLSLCRSCGRRSRRTGRTGSLGHRGLDDWSGGSRGGHVVDGERMRANKDTSKFSTK
jgi:hypothetical protein